MIKRDELARPDSCMNRAKDDEMTFVLLGRDVAAPAAIRAWIAERVRLGKNKPGDFQIEEARQCADAMARQEQSWDAPNWLCPNPACGFVNLAIRRHCRNCGHPGETIGAGAAVYDPVTGTRRFQK